MSAGVPAKVGPGSAVRHADQANVPKLRLPGFARAWEQTKLSDVAEVYDGTHQTPRYKASGVPFVSVENIGDLKATEKHISEEAYAKDFKIKPRAGDILMTRITAGIIGATSIVQDNQPLAYYVSLALIRTKNDADPKFAVLQIESPHFRHELHKRIIHVAFPKKINLGDLGDCKISLPPIPEQQKIAAFLGAVDAKLAALGARQAALGRFKAGLMQKLFSQQLRFTQDDGQAFPDWQEKRLGDVFTWAKTNSLSRQFLTHDGGDVQNIHYGDIHTKFRPLFRQSMEPVPFVRANSALKPFSDEEYCRVGDVVIADASEDYADVGKTIEIVEVRDRSLVAGLHTYIARPKIGSLVVGFSGYLLRSAPMRRQIMRIAQGISVLGVSKGNLEKLTFWIPHPDEQQKIATAFSAMDARIQAVAEQIAKLQTFKKGLLQQMFV